MQSSEPRQILECHTYEHNALYSAECDRAASVPLGTGLFCTIHFIAYSYRQLEECSEKIKKREHLDYFISNRFLGNVAEIARACVTIALDSTDVNGMEQAQILDILASITSLVESITTCSLASGSPIGSLDHQ